MSYFEQFEKICEHYDAIEKRNIDIYKKKSNDIKIQMLKSEIKNKTLNELCEIEKTKMFSYSEKKVFNEYKHNLIQQKI